MNCNKTLINWFGLSGLIALISYTAAVIISPFYYPGYNWKKQAVSDLSADNAPSKSSWNRIASLYNVCSVVCCSCVSIHISEKKQFSKIFKIGIYIFTIMQWISNVGYGSFPLSESGKDIITFQEIMHIIVTILVVLLSIISLICIIIAGFKKVEERIISILAFIALIMMFVGAVGQGIVPKEYFGIIERFSVFSAVGFNAILGIYLFINFGEKKTLL
ncbi:hypothetical protein BCR36DRAFT_345652 [Piromyces finnis]|uniref:DUF998 domain-containing protein n=1 Tax=Piromyces finnis TaxID=1754191 RepID=A0A1Y1VJC6_9FUNG|nr:hypothetical protein BCR36DRAFT_345652 [Piromyces finnis]|eukprot:ORX56506.1 hypothetical protein BCR36DRAFT_345652 [Piromyces finnis]